ncbi:MAG: cytochrome C oxidase subunit I [Bacteroidota bacterium]
MQNVLTQKSPSLGVVIPHYICGALFFVVLCFLILFSSDAFIGHYFHPKLLAITHIAALGWGTMIILGALYQLLPVILEVPLYSERLAKVTFITFTTGVICLAWAFWNFYVSIHIQVAAILLLLSFSLLVVNIVLTVNKAPKWTTEADFIVTSSVWLIFTGLLGALMAFNFTYPLLNKSHLLFLKIHAHMGIAGWFILLIMGVGSKLIPMFLLSHNLNTKKLTIAYYLVNIGLICFSADIFFREENAFLKLYALLIAAGILFFMSFIYEAYKKRVRKQLDIGLKHSFMAFLFFLLPILLGIIMSFKPSLNDKFMLQIYLVYGTSIFFGFISSLILGQTFKTLPFIMWMHRNSKVAGKQKTLLPKDLYSPKLVKAQYVVYVIALPTLVIGILLSMPVIIKIGAMLLLVTAILYTINVFKIVVPNFKPTNK